MRPSCAKLQSRCSSDAPKLRQDASRRTQRTFRALAGKVSKRPLCPNGPQCVHFCDTCMLARRAGAMLLVCGLNMYMTTHTRTYIYIYIHLDFPCNTAHGTSPLHITCERLAQEQPETYDDSADLSANHGQQCQHCRRQAYTDVHMYLYIYTYVI